MGSGTSLHACTTAHVIDAPQQIRTRFADVPADRRVSGVGWPAGERPFTDPQGDRYRVRIAPRELSGGRGVSENLKAIVFETEEGQWVGAVPVYPHVSLATLGPEELAELLEQAKRRGL
jgi:hypothetical protein